MPAYSKVVSVVRQIDTAHVFIGGERKDITSGWTFVNGVRKQVFPSAENYTKVYENNTPGAYSATLSWGRYKIVLSGAGGGGAAATWTEASGTRYAENGYKGEEKTIYVIVQENDTLTVAGIIGAGGTGGKATSSSATRGTGGAGYDSGLNGTAQYANPGYGEHAATAGGGGGGSTNIEWDSTQYISAGGNGGTARQSKFNIWGRGGKGGSGGTTTGKGASGGTGASAYGSGTKTGGTGSNGYIHIYKSNIYPE